MSDGDNPQTQNKVEILAVQAGVKYLNEHKGGIAGHPIDLIACDSQLDPAKTVDCANQMVQDNVTAVVMGGLASQDNAWQVLHNAHIPMLWAATNSDSVLKDADTSFVLFNAKAALVDLPLSVAKEHNLKKMTVFIVDVPAAKGSYGDDTLKIFKDAGIDVKVVPVPIGTADFTPLMQDLQGTSDSVSHMVAYDAFCIAAFQAMQALNVTGPISANSQCITDATRKAIPGSFLKGLSLVTEAPVGNVPETELYRAVIQKYDPSIDPTRVTGATSFMALLGLETVADNITGDITSPSIISGFKSMKWIELPASGGLHFRCNGKAVAEDPALCVRGALATSLDDQGQPSAYQVIGDTPIED